MPFVPGSSRSTPVRTQRQQPSSRRPPRPPQLSSTIPHPGFEAQQEIDIENTFGPELTVDDYLAQFNASLPAAGANIQRTLSQGLEELGRSRQDAADVAAELPGAFQGSFAGSSQALTGAEQALGGAVSPDVAPQLAGAARPLQANLFESSAANLRGVPGFNQAIAQGFAERKEQLERTAGEALDEANFERAFRLMQLATEQANLDRSLREQERVRRDEIRRQTQATRQQQQFERDALAQAEEQQRRAVRDELAIGEGFESAQAKEEIIQSAPFRRAVQLLEVGEFPRGEPGGIGPVPRRFTLPENRQKPLARAEVVERYRGNPELLRVLLLEGYVSEEDFATAKVPLPFGPAQG